ncbi:hypothetical protein ACHAWT_007395 [Skeletonema menzelii]
MRRGTKIALGVVAPVVVIGIVLGVLFGLRKGGNKPGGEETPQGEDELVRSVITASPSGMPSVKVTEAPVEQCPIGRKEFILKYSNRGNDDSDGNFSTWYVKDICTGEKIVSCAPCPSLISEASASLSHVAVASDTPSLSPTSGLPSLHSSSLTAGLSSTPSSVASDKTSSSLPTSSPVATSMNDTSIFHIKDNGRRLQNKQFITRNAQQTLQDASRECILSDLSYVFVVEFTENPGECCSFHAEEYVVTYDSEVIAFVGAHGSSTGSSSIERMILFGETGRTCPSNSPSEVPSVVPSGFPSAVPSMDPSGTVSNSPSVVSSEVPSISPSSAQQSMPPSMNPSIQPSTMNPTLNSTTTTTTGLTSLTLSPTTPSTEVEQIPVPSLRPTCKTDRNFNLCIAVDMSGSICSNDGACIGCPSDTCRDELVTQGTCCNNFAFVKGFASLLIQSLSTFPADKTFSIVQFATEGQLISLMETNTEAISTIDELYYTGGITNHAEAISECRRSLSASHAFQQTASATAVPHQNFMVLITDGKPTTPGDDPLGAALSQARIAEDENGLFIIPVFISPKYDEDALAFMRGLSSNDKVFDVVDFESLNTLKDRLLKEVSCSL